MTIRVHAQVNQLAQSRTYVNIMNDIYQGIGIWGHAQCPTYLLIKGDNWLVVTYDTEEVRDESLKELAQRWIADRILEIPSMKEVNA